MIIALKQRQQLASLNMPVTTAKGRMCVQFVTKDFQLTDH